MRVRAKMKLPQRMDSVVRKHMHPSFFLNAHIYSKPIFFVYVIPNFRYLLSELYVTTTSAFFFFLLGWCVDGS